MEEQEYINGKTSNMQGCNNAYINQFMLKVLTQEIDKVKLRQLGQR